MPDLDQVFTSAGYALSFALANWDEFRAHAEKYTGRPLPVGWGTVAEHARHIVALIDPERIPSD